MADRQRVVGGTLSGGAGFDLKPKDLDEVIAHLAPRWLLPRSSYSRSGVQFRQPRRTTTLMRGSGSRSEIRRVWQMRQNGRPGAECSSPRCALSLDEHGKGCGSWNLRGALPWAGRMRRRLSR